MKRSLLDAEQPDREELTRRLDGIQMCIRDRFCGGLPGDRDGNKRKGKEMFHAFLIKYGEIGIKGKNRYLFEDALVAQIRHALKQVEGEFRVTKEQGRIYAEAKGEYDYDDAVDALSLIHI